MRGRRLISQEWPLLERTQRRPLALAYTLTARQRLRVIRIRCRRGRPTIWVVWVKRGQED